MNPKNRPIPSTIHEIVIMLRLNLYNHGLACGAEAIQTQLEKFAVKPMPSLSTINRILKKHGLTHGRTGHYE